MKYAVIARPPVMGGKIASYDGSAAMKVPGVEKIVVIEGTPPPSKFQPIGGVAVIARNTWAAIKGRDALIVKWDDGPHASYDSTAYKAQLEETARKPGKVVRNEGDAEQALGSAAKTVVGGILRAASGARPDGAAWRHGARRQRQMRGLGGRAEPRRHAQRAGREARPKPEDVTVNVTLLGGGFGRKSKPDFVLEAALLSREMGGAPVKVTWTREDDLHHDYFHTRLGRAHRCRARCTRTRRRVAPPQRRADDPGHLCAGSEIRAGGRAQPGVLDVPFDVANLRCEVGEAEAHTRIGWFRSVSNIPHAFAVQSFVAELAHAAGRDPKEMLIELIGPPRIVELARRNDTELRRTAQEIYPIDTARLRRVVELVADKAEWGKKLPPRHGQGIAVHRSFLSYVATVVEVAVDDKGKLTVPRVDTAIDCGFAANPERIYSQIEGAAVMGLSLAKYGEISFKNGRVEQNNFDGFQVARIDESPPITHVWIVPNGIDVPSSGVGEPGLPPFAPALCNAIFAATGKRIRRLPIGDQLAA